MKVSNEVKTVLIAAAAALFSNFVLAQESADSYPAKPVRIVVPTAPGGATDIQARLFAQKLSENMRGVFFIDNRPGAGNTIGTSFVAKSAPDGYTLLALAPGFTFSPALYKNLPYDSEKDFAPISLMVKSPYLLAVHPSLPVTSVKEWIQLAKARPGQLNTGVANGAFSHLATVWLLQSANVNVQVIPFKGVEPAVFGTMTGDLQMVFGNVISVYPHVKTGKLKLLGASMLAPSAALPNVPIIAEAIPGFELSSWHGWAAPAGTPAVIINRISAELARISKSPEIAKALQNDGGEAVAGSPEQLRQLISTEIGRWRKVVAKSNMTVQ